MSEERKRTVVDLGPMVRGFLAPVAIVYGCFGLLLLAALIAQEVIYG